MVIFYEILLILIAIAVLMSLMTHGFHTGAVKNVSILFSLAAAALCLYLLSGIFHDFLNVHLGGLVAGLVMLAVVVMLYRLFHLIFTAIDLIAKLPVIHWLDSALGLVLGLAEGVVVLYLAQYLLENYILR